MSDEIIITESSYRKLQKDVEHMKTVKRAEIADALRKARAYGDLSENFEYHAARREQGILNGRIAELERTLEMAKVVPDPAGGTDEISLGSIVLVQEVDADDEDDWEFTIVDAVQADPMNDMISNQSPIAKAMMNKKVGDIVEVQIPAGTITYKILNIRHE
jgi:transcription elongation factor GreA